MNFNEFRYRERCRFIFKICYIRLRLLRVILLLKIIFCVGFLYILRTFPDGIMAVTTQEVIQEDTGPVILGRATFNGARIIGAGD